MHAPTRRQFLVTDAQRCDHRAIPIRAPLERCTQAHREDPGIRAVHDRLGDKWSLLVIVELTHGPLRFRQLQRAVGGISQRMLTLTVRRLERDGPGAPHGLPPRFPPKSITGSPRWGQT